MYLRVSISFFFTMTISLNVTVAQESFYFGKTLHEVRVSELQDESLTEIEDRLNDEVAQLREQLRKTQQKLRQRVFERTVELETVLMPDQLKSLNEKRRAESIKSATTNANFMVEFAKFLEAVSSANTLTIYEGLPRATDLELKIIKDKNKTIEINGWAFYAEPLPAKSSIVEKLRSSLVDYKSFEPYSDGKFCGGFHPDFCVKWETGNKTFYVQVCLSCFEAVFITPDDDWTFDFDDAAWKSFAQIAISTFTKHADRISKLDAMLGQ